MVPAEIIGHAVWLYSAFHWAAHGGVVGGRGIIVSHETVRQWRKFGQQFANQIRASAGWRQWHLDEVVLKITG
jgi:transposase-like protein